MAPNVITTGFKWSGNYSLNPKAISCGITTEKSTSLDTSHSEMSQDTHFSGDADDHILDLSDYQVKHFEK